MEVILERPVAEHDEATFDDETEETVNPAAACQLGTLACDTCVNVGCPLLALRGDTIEKPTDAWSESEPSDDIIEPQTTRDMLFDDSIDVVVAQPEQPIAVGSSHEKQTEQPPTEPDRPRARSVIDAPTAKTEPRESLSRTADSPMPVATETTEQRKPSTTTTTFPEPKQTPIIRQPEPAPEQIVTKTMPTPEPPKAKPSLSSERGDGAAEPEPAPERIVEEGQSVVLATPVVEMIEPEPTKPARPITPPNERPRVSLPNAEAQPTTAPMDGAAGAEVATDVTAEAVESDDPVAEPAPASQPQPTAVDEIVVIPVPTEPDLPEHFQLLLEQPEIEREPTSFIIEPTEQLDFDASFEPPGELSLDDIADDVAPETPLLQPNSAIAEPTDETPLRPEIQLIEEIFDRAFEDESVFDAATTLSPNLQPEPESKNEFSTELGSDTDESQLVSFEVGEVSQPETDQPKAIEPDSELQSKHNQNILDNLVVYLTTCDRLSENCPDPEAVTPFGEQTIDCDRQHAAEITEAVDTARQEFSVEYLVDPEQPSLGQAKRKFRETLLQLLGKRAYTLA